MSAQEVEIPQHIAIIMDGNRRWATQRNISDLSGYQAGMQAARSIINRAAELGVGCLTLFASSPENWEKSKEWFDSMRGLIIAFFQGEISQLIASNVQLRIIGNRESIDPEIQSFIIQAEEATEENDGLVLQIAISYEGRDEIIRAIRHIAADVARGCYPPWHVDESVVSDYLDTTGVPDPDLVIRTGGERGISNFLLWQLAHAEQVFVDEFWPDFTPDLFDQAIIDYYANSSSSSHLNSAASN